MSGHRPPDRPGAKALADVPIAKINVQLLEEFYAELHRCRDRCNGRIAVDHRVDGPHECRTIRHRRRPGRPSARTELEHDCAAAKRTVIECPPHTCRPLSASSIRQIHIAVSSALGLLEPCEDAEGDPFVAAVADRAG